MNLRNHSSSSSLEYADLELLLTPRQKVYDPKDGIVTIRACLNAYCSTDNLQCQFWNPIVDELIMTSASNSPHVSVNLSHFHCLRRVRIECQIPALNKSTIPSEIRLKQPLELDFPDGVVQPILHNMVGL